MIGGNLSLEPISLKRINQKLFPENQTFWLQSGRGGLTLIIKLLGLKPKDEVLLPSYHCEEIVKPFVHNKIQCTYYPIEKDLQVKLNSITVKVNSHTKLVIVIPYAGQTQKEITVIEAWCQQKKIPLLKDNVPLIPNHVRPQPNVFQLYSFRKYAGVPSGATLVLPKEFKKKNYPPIRFLPPQISVELLQISALLLRSLSQFFSWNYLWLISYKLYCLGEKSIDNKIRRISKLSYYWIERINWKTIAEKRRKNANYLQRKLSGIKEVVSLNLSFSKGTAPLFFPIITDEAKSIKLLIRKENIFATQLWHFPSYLTPHNEPSAYWIANNILYLSIDQRYSPKEMDYQIEKLKGAIKHD